jgi:signal transduction histidine kinase
MENSFQSMPEGGRLTVATECVAPQGDRGYVKIVITDTGSGVQKELLAKIIEPFYTTKEKGTGLGLAIVNRVVESHHGKFTIESDAGHGTRCTVLLPVE